MKGLQAAFSFLTLLPMKIKNITLEDLQNSIIFFPWVGAFEGTAAFLGTLILQKYFNSTEISALTILIIIFLIRGIFHLDGLSDTLDAFFYKSSGNEELDKKRRLQIMKDSTVGVGGVWAVFMDLLFKFVLLKNVVKSCLFFWPLIFTFCFSRWALLPVMFHGKPAKNEGLGAIFIGKISFKQVLIGSILPLFLLLLFIFKTKKFIFLLLPFILYINSIIIVNICSKKFGGLTGDNLGATVEISEILVLLFWRIYG